MPEKKHLEGLHRLGKAIFESGLTDFIPGGTLAGKLAKAAGRVLGVGEDPETVAELIEKGLDPTQAGMVREAMASEVRAYEETKREILKTEQVGMQEATERLRIASMGDNLWSKLWRPVVGYVVMALFLIDHIVWRVATLRGFDAGQNEFLYKVAWAIVAFYYGGRTVQHVGSMFATAQKLKNK